MIKKYQGKKRTNFIQYFIEIKKIKAKLKHIIFLIMIILFVKKALKRALKCQNFPGGRWPPEPP